MLAQFADVFKRFVSAEVLTGDAVPEAAEEGGAERRLREVEL